MFIASAPGANPISRYTYCRNESTYQLTLVNFTTEDRMPRNTYLYDNKMFTNKVKCSIIQGGKEKVSRTKMKRVGIN